jgi:APA family basic amino acid/polyamine antiporter
LSQARIFLAMARDKLLPPSIFGAVHPRFKTPHISTALTGFCICIVAALTPIEALGEMVNIGTLFAFTVVCITVLILRIQKPEMPRPFRCPLLYVVAPAGVIVNVAMMLFLPLVTWVRLFVWMAIGMAFYFAYGYRHSILGKELVTELAKEGVAPNTRR